MAVSPAQIRGCRARFQQLDKRWEAKAAFARENESGRWVQARHEQYLEFWPRLALVRRKQYSLDSQQRIRTILHGWSWLSKQALGYRGGGSTLNQVLKFSTFETTRHFIRYYRPCHMRKCFCYRHAYHPL